MRSDIDLTNFTSGQLSPRMKGRTDHKAYFNGCETCLNFVIMPQGGATARPGTAFVALTKEQLLLTKLVPFIFSTIQAYMLSFSNGNVRVYMNDGVVLSGGVPVDVAVPYSSSDLPLLKYTQSADTLFLVHPNYPPATLTRTSHTNWTYTVLAFRDGPYLSLNVEQNNVSWSGTSGAITLTWDNTKGINNGAGFVSADVGRCIRIKTYSSWGWCVITNVNTPTQVFATVQAQVTNGAQGYLDGAPWQANTLYATNTVVSNGTYYGGLPTYYIASSGGTSASGVGPQGLGSSILDGSVIWSCLSSRNASRLQRTTVYDVNDVVQNAANDFFQAVVGGKSDSSTSNEPSRSGAAVQVDGTVQWAYLPPFAFPSKTLNWALGAFGGANLYPMTAHFWQERLCFGGFPGFPNRIVGSVTEDFTNFAPSKADNTVLASNSIDWIIADDQVNAINWLCNAGSAASMQLGIGTFGSEHILQAAAASQALSPTSVQSYQESTFGSGNQSNALRIGKSVLFMDRTMRKLREWSYYYMAGGYVGPDKLEISENISRAGPGLPSSGNGLFDLCYQQSPYQVIWCRRGDGTLVSFTYDRDEQVFAPAVHLLGGTYYQSTPRVESLAVIPSTDGSYDEVWMVVARTTSAAGSGAQVQRTIEVLTRYFDGQSIDEAFFVDCAVSTGQLTTPAGTLFITGATNSAAATQAPSYTGTASIAATSAQTWAVNDVVRANGGMMVISAVADSQDATATIIRPLKNLAPCQQGTWTSITPKGTFSGLNHLEGQQVWLFGDGADLGYVTVSGGAITVPDGQKISYATAGLLAAPVLVTMPWEPVRAAGAATQGKMKDIDRLYARFHETRGARYGRRTTDSWTRGVEDKLTPMEDRDASDPMDNAPPMQHGIYVLEPTQDYDLEGQIIFTRDGAAPMTIVSVFARGEVAEMPQP